MRSVGLGAPSRTAANIAGAVLGLLWGALFLSSILQFDPNANIAQITGFRPGCHICQMLLLPYVWPQAPASSDQ